MSKHLGIDSDDLNDILIQIEKSFGFKFLENDFFDGMTYAQLLDCINNKITLQHIDDCTSQQAFYKLREALVISGITEKENIKPDTPIKNIFHRKGRRKSVKKAENILGFELYIFEVPNYLVLAMISIFIISLVGIYFKWQFIYGIIASIIILRIAPRLTNKIRLVTIRELTQDMLLKTYARVRRNANTYNENEILSIIKLHFLDYGFEEEELTPDTVIM